MEIKDLEAGQGKIDITVEIASMQEPRAFDKFGKSGKVANAKAKDASGEITLTLWNEQCDQVKVGMKIHITNGYVSEFKGEKQLGTGKFGKLEIVQ
jgi:replication factor A1